MKVIGGPFSSFLAGVLPYTLESRVLVSDDKSLTLNRDVVRFGGDGSFFSFSFSLSLSIALLNDDEYVLVYVFVDGFSLSSSVLFLLKLEYVRV